jgi:hypothetical protein
MRTGPDQALALACASALAQGWSAADLEVPVTVVPDLQAGLWRVKFPARDPVVPRAAIALVDDRSHEVKWLPVA